MAEIQTIAPPSNPAAPAVTPPAAAIRAGTPTMPVDKNAPLAAPRVSPQLAALTKREKEAIAREQSASAREAAAVAKETTIAAREARIAQFDAVKTNPLKALELLGLSYNDLSQAALADGNIPPEITVKKIEDKLNGFLTAQEKKAKDDELQAAETAKAAQEQQEQGALSDFKSEISDFVAANAADLELCAFEGEAAIKTIFEVIDEYYNRTCREAIEKAIAEGQDVTGKKFLGKILSVKDAAGHVEKSLEQKYEPVLGLKKFSGRVIPTRPGHAPKLNMSPPPGNPNPTPKQAQSLNNGMAGQSRVRTGIRTDEERTRDALAYWANLRRG